MIVSEELVVSDEFGDVECVDIDMGELNNSSFDDSDGDVNMSTVISVF